MLDPPRIASRRLSVHPPSFTACRTASRVFSLISSLSSIHCPSNFCLPVPFFNSSWRFSAMSTTDCHRRWRSSFSFLSISGLTARYSARAFASLTVRNRRPSRLRLEPLLSPWLRLRLLDMRPPAARSWEPKPPFPPQTGAVRRSGRSVEVKTPSRVGSKDWIHSEVAVSCLLFVVVRTSD